jgi:hypothetical protein
MYPPTWGPLFHDVLWFVAEHYPAEPSEAHRQSVALLLQHLYANLPCLACMVDASIYVQLNPPALESHGTFVQWVVDQHNYVNAKLGKKSDWTVAEARAAFHARHFGDLANLQRAEQKRVEDHSMLQALEVENKRLSALNARFAELQLAPAWCTPRSFGALVGVAVLLGLALCLPNALWYRRLNRLSCSNGTNEQV